MTNLACTLAAALLSTTMVMGGQQTPREAAIARAKEKLIQESAVRADQLELIQTIDAVARDFPDAGLGCPRPGMMYAQVITPGYRVTLRVRGDRFIVHATTDRAVICETPAGAPGTSGGGAPGTSADGAPGATAAGRLSPSDAVAGLKLAEQARTDLARRLRVGRERVTITRYRATTWPDAGLGCPAKGKEAEALDKPTPTRGFVIELASGGRSYEYHSDMTRVVSCTDSAEP